MSPEQVLDRSIDSRPDIFSFGMPQSSKTGCSLKNLVDSRARCHT